MQSLTFEFIILPECCAVSSCSKINNFVLDSALHINRRHKYECVNNLQYISSLLCMLSKCLTMHYKYKQSLFFTNETLLWNIVRPGRRYLSEAASFHIRNVWARVKHYVISIIHHILLNNPGHFRLVFEIILQQRLNCLDLCHWSISFWRNKNILSSGSLTSVVMNVEDLVAHIWVQLLE